jgi:hypothetical protein
MKTAYSTILLFAVLVLGMTACTIPRYTQPTPSPTSTSAVLPTLTFPTPPAIAVTPNSSPTVAPTALPQFIVTQNVPAGFCDDPQATNLINRLKSALQTSNGKLLASLVSPLHGMDVRYYRNGHIVNYDQTHAQFLFESTYPVDWGLAPGSGLPTRGSFHEIVLPALLDVFNKNYTLTCNQIQVGGTTYQVSWPYKGINFYSAYFPGTKANGSLDWRTLAIGMEYVSGKPYLYALMQFQWEP